MDRALRVWFPSLQEDTMKRFERLTYRVVCAAGIAVPATIVLGLSPALAGGAQGARSAKEVRGASPYIEIKNEPAPTLMAGLPPGPHKVGIELVDSDPKVFPGQSKTVTFTIPKGVSHSR
jgi:hypothetical protein